MVNRVTTRVRNQFFMNVDLDVQSGEDLTPLVRALEPMAVALERPEGMASFELNNAVSPTDPAELIADFVQLIVGLPPQARAAWDRAERRVFDIGLQSGRHPQSETHHLSGQLLRAAADIGADIAVTPYALEEEEGHKPSAAN